MRGTLSSLCLGVALTVGALGATSAARAQPLWFDPVLERCDLGQLCVGDPDCAMTMGADACVRVGDGGDPLRCRPTLPFFACCNGGMCAEGDPRVVLGRDGPECLCVHDAISACFGSDGAPPIAECLSDPVTGELVTSLSDGDCDGDRCVNDLDPDPCDDTVGCEPPDAGPRDGGPLDGGPRDGGSSFDARPGDGDADVDVDAFVEPADASNDDAALCPAVVLPEEDCGTDGTGNGCDDDANGTVDDGCGENTDAGEEPEDAATPPRDSGSRRDMGNQAEDDAGEEPEEDAGEEPKMDAATGDPSTDGRVFRGSGGCGICSVSHGERDAALPWLALGIYGLTAVIRSRIRRRRKPLT